MLLLRIESLSWMMEIHFCEKWKSLSSFPMTCLLHRAVPYVSEHYAWWKWLINRINMYFKKFQWWDRWNSDSNCNRHQVYLLKTWNSAYTWRFCFFPKQRQHLVEDFIYAWPFTGVYIASVDVNDNQFYRPDGKFHSFLWTLVN